MDVEQGAAIAIVRMVMAALTLALDTPDISLEDRTASCLVAERVMCPMGRLVRVERSPVAAVLRARA
jgi:hypothetical protein